MDAANLAVMIPIVAIIGGIMVAIVSVISRARVRELEIKERIAMIERGLVPAPETDPRGFDRAMGRLERQEQMADYRDYRHGYRYGRGRHKRAGVTLIGVGFGLMLLIGFTGGDPSSAVGVGGFLVIIGIAFFINSLIESPLDAPAPGPRSFGTPTSASNPAEPPRRD
jgi:hypothetical protein